MASEFQIAANRRNAQRSSGPPMRADPPDGVRAPVSRRPDQGMAKAEQPGGINWADQIRRSQLGDRRCCAFCVKARDLADRHEAERIPYHRG